MKHLFALIGFLIVFVGSCFGIYFHFDGKYVQAGDFKKAMDVIQKIGIRLDYKIIEDRLTNVRKDIYIIEDRYCPDKSQPCTEKDMPEVVRKQYRELKVEKEKLEKELDGAKR